MDTVKLVRRVPSLSFIDSYYNTVNMPALSEETMTAYGTNQSATVYGELTTNGASNMFNRIAYMDFSTKTFVDLGCGLGRVLCAAKLCGFGKVIGIEIAPERSILAQDIINELAITTQYSEQLLDIQIVNNDMFKVNLSELNADVVYVSNLCFTAEMNDMLGVKLSTELKKGSYVFSTRPIEIIGAQLKHVFDVKQSWTDKSMLYAYEN